MVLMRPELSGIKQIVASQSVLFEHARDVARFRVQRECRRRMRKYLNSITRHLVKTFDLQAAGVSAGDDIGRATKVFSVKRLALSPRASRTNFRKPRLQPVLEVPDDRHVRQIDLHRFGADKPHKLDAGFLTQLFETRLPLAILD